MVLFDLGLVNFQRSFCAIQENRFICIYGKGDLATFFEMDSSQMHIGKRLYRALHVVLIAGNNLRHNFFNIPCFYKKFFF